MGQYLLNGILGFHLEGFNDQGRQNIGPLLHKLIFTLQMLPGKRNQMSLQLLIPLRDNSDQDGRKSQQFHPHRFRIVQALLLTGDH